MTRKWTGFIALMLGLVLIGAACSNSDDSSDTTAGGSTSDSTQSLLDTVKANDSVKCGTRDALPGFAVLGDDGTYRGFDSDFCRAVAAAVLGDANKVEMVPLETAARFTALQSGEIDVLIRNTTWTATRDGGEAATFLATTFYDGQAMMVRADSPYQSVADMDNTTVCLAEGTTTQLNLGTKFDLEGITLTEALSFADTDLVQEAFIAGRCDGWTSDASQLVALRSTYPESEGGPDALRILPDIFSKEPLGPAVADGDTKWAQAVNWAVFATFQAEEWGITSANGTPFPSGAKSRQLRSGPESRADRRTVGWGKTALGVGGSSSIMGEVSGSRPVRSPRAVARRGRGRWRMPSVPGRR